MSSIEDQNEMEAIAIIGMAGRFPGSGDIATYWRNLCQGVESIQHFSDEELLEAGVHPELLKNPNYVKAVGMLDEVDQFDAAFFGYNPREAEAMDPQQRIFLECGYHALEHAGINPDAYEGRIGVFGGVGFNLYMFNFSADDVRSLGTVNIGVQNDKDFLATRVSYKLNLKGPSFTVQTACSTALVAAHLGCQSLLNYQSDIAMAGSVSLRTLQKSGYVYQDGGILSPDGRCRAFDAKAQGTLFGSGAGAVVMKRLSEALADGDSIHAIIKGSAINNDGSDKVGFTAPAVDGQFEVISEALAVADVDPATITYIEAHGTGTALGDPIEIAALTKAFRAYTDKKQYCGIGSVKSNIGHCDTAAGMAGLIKAVHALSHRKIPPSLHYETPNPEIDFENSPFFVNTSLRDWETERIPRRAGVSSFGMGGTNAHLILEEPPEARPTLPGKPYQLLIWSAQTESAREAMSRNLAAFLESHREVQLADVAYTLQEGRRALSLRGMLVCHDVEDAIAGLADPKRVLEGATVSPEAKAVFMFPGQGAQYANMGRDLYESEAVFRETLDACCDRLRPHLGLDLRTVLFPPPDAEEEANQRLEQTHVTQPALFVISYCLARQWMAWGVTPTAMIGHSIGEYVAACLAGVLELDEALKLVALRGALMQQLPRGAMLAVPLSEEELRPRLTDCDLAAVNAPLRCVASGPESAIEELAKSLRADGIRGVRLHTSHAFHSRMMEPILQRFREAVSHIALQPPKIPYLSNLSGAWITETESTSPSYWVDHLRGTVRFADGARELLGDSEHVLIEVGPGRTLQSLAKQLEEARDRDIIASIRHAKDDTPDTIFLTGALGRAWLAGVPVHWRGLREGERRARISLPTYPFQRRRYWNDKRVLQAPVGKAKQDLGKNPDLAQWFYTPSWRRTPPPKKVAAERLRREPTTWMLFLDEMGIGEELAVLLVEAGQRVIRVLPGEHSSGEEDSFTIPPGDPEAYARLLKQTYDGEAPITRIVHLWSYTATEAAPHDAKRLDQATERGFYSLLYLAKALAGVKLVQPLRLGVCANGVQVVESHESLVPEKAPLIGPCRVIPQELSEVFCRCIEFARENQNPDSVSAQILAEMLDDHEAALVAYRGSFRWLEHVEALPIADGADGVQRLRQEGVYLITGGLGGIGLALAEYLATHHRAKLVLLGRSAFPPPEEWDAWLDAHEETDPVSAKIQKLRTFQAAGAEIFIGQADVADQRATADLTDRVLARWGAIHGVIHSAGVPGGGLIQLKTPALAEKVFAPKIQGSLALCAAVGPHRPDFILFCASLASLFGGMGQVDYCAANAFQDAFALWHTRETGIPTLSVDWDAWEEVGMAVKARETLGESGKPPAATKPRAKSVEDASKTTAAPAAETGSLPKEPAAPSVNPAMAHPLFDGYREDGARETFISEFSPEKHWVLGEHLVQGMPTLVGTSYLEMARAAFESHAAGAFTEIREVLFLQPMIFSDPGAKQAHTMLQPTEDGYDFLVRGAAGADENGAPIWRDHVRAKIKALPAEAEEPHDLDAIRARCSQGNLKVPPGSRNLAQGSHMSFGPRWNDLNMEIDIGEEEGLVMIELPEALAGDLQHYHLHPSVLDAATSFAGSRAGDGDFYLPFGYEKLIVKAPLTRRTYSHVVNSESSGQARKEILSRDILIMDEQGRELVAIQGFRMKRVGEQARQALKAAPAPAGTGTDGGSGRTLQNLLASQDGILPAEGAEAFVRLLSDPGWSQIAVSISDLPTRLEKAKELKKALLAQLDQSAEESRERHPRPNLKTKFVAPTSDIEKTLAELWQKVLGIDALGIHDDFLELGGNSLVAIQVTSQISEEFQIDLPNDALFTAPTIAELSDLILSTLTADVDQDAMREMLEEIETG